MNLTQSPSFGVVILPTVSLTAYATGDQIGTEGKYEIQKVCEPGNGIALLQSIVIIDADKQKAAIDLLFFNANPTVASSDNAAFDVADAEVLKKLIGSVSVVAGDYADLNVSAVATKKDIQLPLQPLSPDTGNPTGSSLWVCFVSRGTPTYTNAAFLKFRLAFQ